MSETQRQAAIREMKQIENDLNRLSQSEEQLKNQSKEAQPNSNVFRDLAEQQSEKKDELGQTASKAMELAQKSTAVTPDMGKEMGQAFDEMQQAEDAMTGRNQQSSHSGRRAGDGRAQSSIECIPKGGRQTRPATGAVRLQWFRRSGARGRGWFRLRG